VKLQGFLESSTRYDPACLLSEVVDTDMYRECSVLYGRVRVYIGIIINLMEEHFTLILLCTKKAAALQTIMYYTFLVLARHLCLPITESLL
jgi:hypothetical protein